MLVGRLAVGQGARGLRDSAAAELRPLAGAVTPGDCRCVQVPVAQLAAAQHGGAQLGPGRPVPGRGHGGPQAAETAAARRGERLAGGLQVELVDRRRHRRQGRAGLRPRIDRLGPARQRLGFGQAGVAAGAFEQRTCSRQRVAADLIEHLVGLPDFLGADDRGAGPRAAAGLQRQPAQPGVVREVFGGLAGCRLAEGLDRRAAEPELRPGRLQAEQLGPHVIDRHVPRCPPAVQGMHVRVELVAASFHKLEFGAVVRARRVPAGIKRLPDHLRERAAGTDTAMQVQHQLAEVLLAKPLGHRIDRGALLGHEQHFLAAGNQRGDQVGDRLALAGSRRALDDQALPREHRVDRVVLARVGIQHQELISQRHLIRARDRLRPRPLGPDRRAGLLIARQRRDQLMRDQLIQCPVKVSDHRQLGIGEVRQHQPRVNPETRYLPCLLADPLIGFLQLPRLIDRAVRDTLHQRRVINLAAEVDLQHVQQGRVDLHRLPDHGKLELILRRADRTQRGGLKQDRRTRLPRGPLVLPRRQPAPDRQRLQAPFFEILLSLVMDRADPPQHLITLLRITEQRRDPGRLAQQQPSDRVAIRRRQIQSAALQVPVMQQVVASAEINKRVLPVRGRLLHQPRAPARLPLGKARQRARLGPLIASQ